MDFSGDPVFKWVLGGDHRSWKTVQLPEELLRRVDALIGHPGFGYTSRSEFIKDAVRRRVEELEAEIT